MYLKSMLTWYVVVRLDVCSYAEEEEHPLFLTFCVGYTQRSKQVAAGQGVGGKDQGRV